MLTSGFSQTAGCAPVSCDYVVEFRRLQVKTGFRVVSLASAAGHQNLIIGQQGGRKATTRRDEVVGGRPCSGGRIIKLRTSVMGVQFPRASRVIDGYRLQAGRDQHFPDWQ